MSSMLKRSAFYGQIYGEYVNIQNSAGNAAEKLLSSISNQLDPELSL